MMMDFMILKKKITEDSADRGESIFAFQLRVDDVDDCDVDNDDHDNNDNQRGQCRQEWVHLMTMLAKIKLKFIMIKKKFPSTVQTGVGSVDDNVGENYVCYDKKKLPRTVQTGVGPVDDNLGENYDDVCY